MLISNETENKLNLLIQRFFQHNRTWDRFIGYATVEWSLDNFGKVFHHGLAHLYPLLADKVSDILLRYDVAPEYLETKSDVRTYDTLESFFKINLDEHKQTYELIKETINVASINGDLNVETDLKHLLRIFNHFMEQALLLEDKAKIYGVGQEAMFDAFANQFYILQNENDYLVGDKENY